MSPAAINFSWLLKLRWGAIAGQLATIVAVQQLYGMRLPLVALSIVIAIEALSNLACQLRARRVEMGEGAAASVMLLDTLLLTALLHFTGGPLNPFSFLYLVQIALAAVILPARATWALVACALVGSGSLFVMQARQLEGLSHEAYMALHLRGMWFAFGVAATFIVYFLMRVRRDLEAREDELRAAHALAERQQRVASLATLAAGAAHELATPLSTIALVAKELDRRLSRDDARLVDDVQLIRSEVARCRGILDSMAAEAGQTAGETLVSVKVRELVDEAVARARPAPRVDIAVSGLDAPLHLPRRALTQALQSLLANAQDASEIDCPVRLEVERSRDGLVLDVIDRGRGMDASLLERVGEPFFTTKPAGRGMGLGLFLTRTLVESLGGTLVLSSQPGQGTRARIALALP